MKKEFIINELDDCWKLIKDEDKSYDWYPVDLIHDMLNVCKANMTMKGLNELIDVFNIRVLDEYKTR